MSFTTKIIHVDEQDWQSLPSGQRSEIIRNFIKDYSNSIKGNLNDINLELLKVQIVSLENQKIKIDTELQSKKSILANALKVQEEDRVNRLEADKKRIEDSKKCKNCGKMLAEEMKFHNFPIGAICHSCYLNADGSAYKRWNSGTARTI